VNNNEERIRAFLNDVVAVCESHGMAIINQDEYGMAAVPFPEERPTAAIVEVYAVYPGGYEMRLTTFKESCYL